MRAKDRRLPKVAFRAGRGLGWAGLQLCEHTLGLLPHSIALGLLLHLAGLGR